MATTASSTVNGSRWSMPAGMGSSTHGRRGARSQQWIWPSMTSMPASTLPAQNAAQALAEDQLLVTLGELVGVAEEVHGFCVVVVRLHPGDVTAPHQPLGSESLDHPVKMRPDVPVWIGLSRQRRCTA